MFHKSDTPLFELLFASGVRGVKSLTLNKTLSEHVFISEGNSYISKAGFVGLCTTQPQFTIGS